MGPASRAMQAMLYTLVLAGCSTMPEAASSDPLAGTAWTLSQLAGDAHDDAVGPSLRFADGRASGTDGCNRYQMEYAVEGQSLRLSARGASTRMACEDGSMRRAAAFMQALSQVQGWRIVDDRLELRDAGGSLLAAFDAQSTALAGTRWIATGISNGRGAVASVDAGMEVTLEFSDDGARASGLAACNRYGAAVSLDGAALAFAPAAASKKLCGAPPGVMAVEQQFLAVLGTVASARIEGDRLELRTADGALALALVRAAAP